MKVWPSRTRLYVLSAVLLALSTVAFALHRHELRQSLRALRRPTPVADGPRLVAGVPRSAGCEAKPLVAVPRGDLFALPGGRRFTLFGPREARPEAPAPLVVVLHGWGDDGAHFADWFAMHDHVDAAAFVLYPDSDGSWDVRERRDVETVDRMVAAVAARHCIDPARLYAFGFSWGGKLASLLACEAQTPFAAVGIGDSSYHSHARSCAPANVFVTVRTHDHDEQPAWGKDGARRWATTNRCAPDPVPMKVGQGCVEYPRCETGKRVVLCEDAFFDPSWPAAWNHTVRPDFQRLAWSFFDGKLR